MKKCTLIMLAAALSFAACQEMGSPMTEENVLSAVIEQDEATKTVMDDNNNILWSANDQIIAFMKSSYGHKYNLIPSYVGKAYADFEPASSGNGGNLSAGSEWDHNVVYYPYSSSVECLKSGSNYTLDVVLPSEQTYAAESFGNGSMAMVAVSEDNDITFRNVLGGMKLQLKGAGTIASVRIEGNNNETLSGKATVTAYADGTVPSIQMASDASTSVTLNCCSGIQLNESTATEFIISLPPVKFTKGFAITITDAAGDIQTIETSKENEVLRSSLLKMPEVEVIFESQSAIPNNEIHYIATEEVQIRTSGFEQEIISHVYNRETQQGVIIFDGDVTSIKDYAFSRSPLSSVIIPDSVTSIGDFAFDYCESLEEVTIKGENVEYGYNPFRGCESLKKFNGTNASEDGRCLISGTELISVAGCELTELTIPEYITDVDYSVLSSCSSLLSIAAPINLCRDLLDACRDVESLEDITLYGASEEDLYDLYTQIREMAIQRNQYWNSSKGLRLHSQYFDMYIYTLDRYIICEVNNEHLLWGLWGVFPEGIGTFSIPDVVTIIDNYAVQAMCYVIYIPESVRVIRHKAFNEYLEEVIIEGDNLVIEESAFYHCSNLARFYGPMASSDGRCLIYNNELLAVALAGLTEYIIPEEVDKISCLFAHDSSLTTLYIQKDDPLSISGYCFDSCPLQVIYVPNGAEEAYKSHPAWSAYADIIQGYDSLPSVDLEGSDSDKLIDYVDEYGENHGPGVKIGETVWAPVNCGYHKTDFKYGKLYQWGRKYGQGYDKSDASVPEIVEGPVSLEIGQSKENANKFYHISSDPYDWTSPQYDNLWNSGSEDNPIKTEYDPCPAGWRVPTYAEMEELHQNYSPWTTDAFGREGLWFSGASSYTEAVPQVFFPAAGYHYAADSSARYQNEMGYYWSSRQDSTDAYRFAFGYDGGGHLRQDRRGCGNSVRCVQE